MILNIKSPAAPRRRGRRRHPSCGRAITMAQRHGRPPAGAKETLAPASDTHGLADPGRGRPEASRAETPLAATARRHATTQPWRPIAATVSRPICRDGASKSTPGSVTASRRMPAHGLHHRLSSPNGNVTCCWEGAMSRCEISASLLAKLPSAYSFLLGWEPQ